MTPITHIPFAQIESIPKIIKDFLCGQFPQTTEELFTIENIEKKISQKSKVFSSENRKILVNVLKEQLSGVTLNCLQKENLENLLHSNTFTITTGHQLNLFSGPIYFVYKILQTIKTTEFLKEKFPKNNFVPIFWMATEDHDFQEINHFFTELGKYEVNEKVGSAVGRIKITDIQFISDFEKEFSDTYYGKQLIEILKKSHQVGNTFTQATRILVQELFSKWGIISIDGDHKELKKIFSPIIKQEIIEQKLYKESQKTVGYIKEKYRKVQVNPRKLNLFFLSDSRNRIDLLGNEFSIYEKNISFNQKEICEILEKNPENFSPNALLRPAYQESILPNIAYIGGNAEVAYWLELKDYFKSIGLSFPILIPRNSLLFIDEKWLKKTKKLELEIEDFFGDFSEIVNNKLLNNTSLYIHISDFEKKLKDYFKTLQKEAKQTDASFENLVLAEEKRQLNSIKKIKKRLIKAEKIKQNELKERLDKIYLAIHPKGIWQERFVHFSTFFHLYGEEWLEFCYKNITNYNYAVSVFSISK